MSKKENFISASSGFVAGGCLSMAALASQYGVFGAGKTLGFTMLAAANPLVFGAGALAIAAVPVFIFKEKFSMKAAFVGAAAGAIGLGAMPLLDGTVPSI